MLAVKAILIQKDHLQEAARNIFHGEEALQATEYLVLVAGAMNQQLELDALGQMGAAEKILVGVQRYALLPVWTEILDVGLYQRRVLAKRLHLRPLLRDNLVHDLHFARSSRLLGECGQGHSGEPKDETQGLQSAHNISET